MNTLFVGKVLLRYKTLKSTNLSAQSLLTTDNPPEGTTIVADVQTEGKGQRGNTWNSPQGVNLLCSIILYPKHLLPKQQFLLTMITSLALLDLSNELGISDVKIKWPNDIYVKKKKLAGILIQNNITAQKIMSSIIGIGLNVNQTEFDPSLLNPTSIKICHGEENLDLEKILERVCYFLEKRYLQTKSSKGIKELRELYTANMYQVNKVASYSIDGKAQAGIIKGVDEFGKLLLQLENETRAFDLQQVKFLL